MFSLREDKEIATFVYDVMAEDPEVKIVTIYSPNGERIARSTPVTEVLRGDWLVRINDVTYHIRSPPRSHGTYHFARIVTYHILRIFNIYDLQLVMSM